MKKLTIAMVAPPWLTVPATGYGGTESVIDHLCRGLYDAGVRVDFYGVEGSTTPARRHYWTYANEQYDKLTNGLDDPSPIPLTHLMQVVEQVQRRGGYDLIHDHNNFFGPVVLANHAGLPPVLHTLHGPFVTTERRNQGFIDSESLYTLLSHNDRLYFNAISRAQADQAPVSLRKKIVAVIHHGIDVAGRTMAETKDDYFVTVGRIAAEKNTGLAAKLCAKLGVPFKIAGVVGGIDNPRELTRALADSQQTGRIADLAYFRDNVVPHLKSGQIEYVGSVAGTAKDQLIGRAKAFLMPIAWDEPFGVAIIDALVCGTPVVAMNRGSMPEIIEHGVNGFLADTPEEFAHYMLRVGEIDPTDCRRSVEEKFSYQFMAQRYAATYERIIKRHASVSRPVSLLPTWRPQPAFYEKLTKDRRKPSS